jgi:hypothetical protein
MMFTSTIQTTGTFQFTPSTAEVIISAYQRIGVKRTELVEHHIQDAVLELNYFLAGFNDAGPNLAQVDVQTISLVQGTAVYTLLAETVFVLTVFLTPSGQNDRFMWPISQSEYDAIPNKTQQGTPNQYMISKVTPPTITLWFVPDGNGPYTLNYRRLRRVQDAQASGGLQPEVPNRAIDAIVAGLAYRLARIYRPQLEQIRKGDAEAAWSQYAKADLEDKTNLYLQPALSGYWRI